MRIRDKLIKNILRKERNNGKIWEVGEMKEGQ